MGCRPLLIDKSILIHAGPDRVFRWLAPARMTQWDRNLIRAATHGPLAKGSRIDRVCQALGFRLQSATEAVAVEPDRMFAWRQLTGDYEKNRGAYTLEPVRAPDGTAWTRVRLVADVELPFVLPRLVTESEVRHALSRDTDAALFNLKELVERSSPPPVAS